MSTPALTGLLLAAGAGSRMGRPKALVESWLSDAVAVLRAGGCDDVLVVLGARAEEARRLIPTEHTVIADDWSTGMAASLRAGLEALTATQTQAALVHLVDLPDVGAEVIARVAAGADRSSLRRAVYSTRPGHPVLIGRDHWAGVLATATGDHGARDYLRSHPGVEVECGDLATGRDIDFAD